MEERRRSCHGGQRKFKSFSFGLPRMSDLDGKWTQAAVEAALEDYKIYKYLGFEEREATVTASVSYAAQLFLLFVSRLISLAF